MAVIFGKRNKIPSSNKLDEIYIDNKQINFVESIKYLGVTLDSDLTWNETNQKEHHDGKRKNQTNMQT